jgi:hypothetical protein
MRSTTKKSQWDENFSIEDNLQVSSWLNTGHLKNMTVGKERRNHKIKIKKLYREILGKLM